MRTPWTTTFEIFCNWRTFFLLCCRDPLDFRKYRVVQNGKDRFNELKELHLKCFIDEIKLLLTLNRIWWIHGDIENHFERSRPWNQIMSVCNWAIFCEMNSYGMLRFDDWNLTRSFQKDSNMYRDLKSHHEQTSRTNFGTQRVCGWRCGRRYYWKTNDPIYDLRNLTFRHRNRICTFSRISASRFRLSFSKREYSASLSCS